MCLKTVTRRYKLLDKVSGTGWKVFEQRRGKLYHDYEGSIYPRPTGEWLHERKFRQFPWMRKLVLGGSTYPTGWHIFRNQKTAEKYAERRYDFLENTLPYTSPFSMVVKKVKYRKAIALGLQAKKSIIVAKEIFIC